MASVPKNDIRFPVKIGEESKVAIYSATLLEGEEQLLVTRDGKFFLTDGKGDFFPFKTNEVYTIKEIDDKFTINTGILNQKIETLTNDVVSLAIEFDDYLKKSDFDTFKLNTDNNIYIIDAKLIELDELGTHSNRDILDLLSKDVDGNLLFNGTKLAVSIETTDVEIDTTIKTIWGDTI